MKKQKGMKPQTLRIDGDKFKHDLPEGYSGAAISEKILGKSKSFLHGSLKLGRIRESDLDRLCFVFNLNKNDYIIKEEEPKVEPEEEVKEEVIEEVTPTTPVAPTVDSTEITSRIDKLINVVEEMGKVMAAIVSIQLDTQKKIDELKLGTLAINQLLKTDLDSIDTELGKTNSSLNIIKGRLGDLCGAPNVKRSA